MMLSLYFCLGLVAANFLPEMKFDLDLMKSASGWKAPTVFAENLKAARSFDFFDDKENRYIFVGSFGQFTNRAVHNVYLLVDEEKDGTVDSQRIIWKGDNNPAGIAIKENSLFIAEIKILWRCDDIISQVKGGKELECYKIRDMPPETYHGWRYIRTHPTKNEICITIGVPCNICFYDTDKFGKIECSDLEGKNVRVVATGVRNSVGFDWHPKTGEMWFTDNGRDQMGDDIPDDELNRVVQEGDDFGFPLCHTQGLG